MIEGMFSFLWGWAVDLAVNMLNMLGGFDLMALSDIAFEPISSANPVAYSAMRTIADTVVRPVASVVLSLMLTVELARNASRFEGDGQIGVRMIAGTMFKFVLLIVAVQYSPQILEAIGGIAQTIMEGIRDTPAPTSVTNQGLGDELRDELNAAGIGVIGVVFLLVIPWLLSLLAYIYAQVMLVLRLIELYLLTAFAPLPVAFAAHPDTKSIAVGYLRGFGATAIHGATLILALYLFQLLVRYGGFGDLNTDDIGNGLDMIGWAVRAFIPLSFTAILLFFVVRSSRQLAKTIVGQG